MDKLHAVSSHQIEDVCEVFGRKATDWVCIFVGHLVKGRDVVGVGVEGEQGLLLIQHLHIGSSQLVTDEVRGRVMLLINKIKRCWRLSMSAWGHLRWVGWSDAVYHLSTSFTFANLSSISSISSMSKPNLASNLS